MRVAELTISQGTVTARQKSAEGIVDGSSIEGPNGPRLNQLGKWSGNQSENS